MLRTNEIRRPRFGGRDPARRDSAAEDAETATFETHAVGDIGPDTDWRAALAGADAVIHLAALAHGMGETVADPSAEFRRINVDGTVRLARHAAECGVTCA